MSNKFRIEPVTAPGRVRPMKHIKVYSKNNAASLPLKIDNSRYLVFFGQGEQFLDRFHEFEVRKDDIWVITVPKCGTTWMLELVWLLANNLDYDTALKVDQEDRSPFFEFCGIFPSLKPTTLDIIDKLGSPRVIKSHLPVHMLPKSLWEVKPKIVYVTREPKDVAISFYHFLTSLGTTKADKSEVLQAILRDEMNYNPFWKHVLEFWELRNEPYIYFTSFERMKSDLRSVVLQICEFLQKSIDEEQLNKLLEHLSFEQMKNNPTCNHLKEKKQAESVLGPDTTSSHFMRKGVVGTHKDELTDEEIQQFDDWTEKALKPYGLTSTEILHPTL